jgi:hypothetical protein
MKSISNWIERKLFLKVNVTKSKVVRPTRSKYLGFMEEFEAWLRHKIRVIVIKQ